MLKVLYTDHRLELLRLEPARQLVLLKPNSRRRMSYLFKSTPQFISDSRCERKSDSRTQSLRVSKVFLSCLKYSSKYIWRINTLIASSALFGSVLKAYVINLLRGKEVSFRGTSVGDLKSYLTLRG